jgi:hypothetical protein
MLPTGFEAGMMGYAIYGTVYGADNLFYCDRRLSALAIWWASHRGVGVTCHVKHMTGGP